MRKGLTLPDTILKLQYGWYLLRIDWSVGEKTVDTIAFPVLGYS